MSEQNGTKVSTKPHRSRQTKQNDIDATPLQQPAKDDKEAWRAYWKANGQSWRAEPEIDVERQLYLERSCNIEPDEKEGIYPFRGVKLNRADVEWLLASHENGRGPVDWSDESQREREGLDLRGADLRHEDLSALPLAKLLGGISWIVEEDWTEEQQIMAAVLLEGTNLRWAHLEGANLNRAQLKGVNLNHAQLESATLCFAQVEDTKVQQAQLKRADIRFAQLKGVYLQGAKLIEANFCESQLEDVTFESANLVGARFYNAQLKEADFRWAQLEDADLQMTQLKGANFRFAKLKGAKLNFAQLEGANLSFIQLEGARLMDIALANSEGIGPQLADIQWGDVNLTVVDWSQIIMLGDERVACEEVDREYGKKKEYGVRLREFKTAARAYRQLAVVLRNQGLNEDSARFAYRAHLMQRKVFRYQHKVWQFLGSLFLGLVSGYGYRAVRCFIAYALVIGVFASIYLLLGAHLTWNEAIVISMTAFHGRGFFPEQFKPGDPQAMVAAIEAFVGLLIEVTFIATLTQRLFGK